LVSLGSNVHHIQSVLVLGQDVGAIVDQHLAGLDVASEGSVVDGRELVLEGLLIDPLLNLVLE
jgi:hypothetical protein